MATETYFKRVIVVGASGNVGSNVLASLQSSSSPNFTITILSRPDSKATFPDNINVVRAAYDANADMDALTKAFESQDVAVFCLGAAATMDQPKLIEAAAAAGIKWFVPNEYAGDGFNKEMVDRVPGFHPKRDARALIEQKGGKWIGICTGPWPETNLRLPMVMGIDINKHHVETYEAMGRFTMSTLPRVGEAIARVLSLPLENPSAPHCSLSHYANNFVYVSSFTTTQKGVVEAVQKATGTKAEEWTQEHHPEKRLELGERYSKEGGNMMQVMVHTMFGAYMQDGAGGDTEAKSKEDMKALGLEEEGIDGVIVRALEWIKKNPSPAW